MDGRPTRQIDFVCPFAKDGGTCSEIMSPMRPAPSNREKKLFVMMNLPLAPTKNGCPRCDVFVNAWKENIGAFGHVKYFLTWFFDKKIRESAPQEQL